MTTTDVDEDAVYNAVQQFAVDLKCALARYDASGTPQCHAGCECDLSQAITAARAFVARADRWATASGVQL